MSCVALRLVGSKPLLFLPPTNRCGLLQGGSGTSQYRLGGRHRRKVLLDHEGNQAQGICCCCSNGVSDVVMAVVYPLVLAAFVARSHSSICGI